MPTNKFLFSSIKAQVTLLTLAVFIVSIWLLAFVASRKLQHDMTLQIGEHQLSATALLAREVNEDLQDRLNSLESLATKISSLGINQPELITQFLRNQQVIHRDYNAGAFVTDRHGNEVSSVYVEFRRARQNYRHISSIDHTLKSGKSNISEINFDKTTRLCMFYISTPIRSASGQIIGALVGATNLANANFLDKISKSHYGKTGYYLLEDQSSRLIITSSDRRRVMKTQMPPNKNQMIDRQLKGYEESGIAVNAFGVEVLTSAKRIPTAGWVMVASLPTTEAFAPIKRLQQRILFAATLMSIAMGGLTWLLLKRELFPVFTTIRTLSTLAQSAKGTELVPVHNKGEIGELIDAFNQLLKKIQERETALQESEFRWKFAIEGAGDGLWDWDLKTNRVFYSKKWKAQLGYSEDEIGDSLDEWQSRIHPDDKADTFTAVENHFNGKTPSYQIEHRLRCKDGSYKWILTRGLVVSTDDNNKPLRVIGTHSDITERRQMTEQIRHQAMFDNLTQLPNRRLLENHLSQAMASSKRYNNFGALMFIDLDNFKPLNDTHGHEAGDLLLKEVAKRLKHCVRETDTVARMGGDEFVIVLSQLYVDKQTSKHQAIEIAEKIRRELEKPYVLDKVDSAGASTKIEHHCSASIGLSLFKGETSTMSDILRHADSAMYKAKSNGRNQVQFYEKD